MSEQPTTATREKDPQLQGRIVRFDNDQERREVIELAFDYRGDVTLHTADGRAVVGYLFDRTPAPGSAPTPGPKNRDKGDMSEASVRLIPADGGPKVRIAYAEITQLEFSGKDTAAGKSWETWVKNYKQKKAMGQSANLHPEPLD